MVKGNKGMGASAANAGHALTIRTSSGSIARRDYHNAECGCGWMCGGSNLEAIKREHASHIQDARESEAAKIAKARMRDAAPDLFEALAGFVDYLDKGVGYLPGSLEQKMRDALTKATHP